MDSWPSPEPRARTAELVAASPSRPRPRAAASVIARVSGDKLHPTNFGRLCTKGATHAEMMRADDGRLKSALLRPGRNDEPVPTPVDDAIAETGRRLRAIIDKHGPDAVALYVSGQMSTRITISGNEIGQGLPAHQVHGVQLATVHGQRGHRIQAVAGL